MIKEPKCGNCGEGAKKCTCWDNSMDDEHKILAYRLFYGLTDSESLTSAIDFDSDEE